MPKKSLKTNTYPTPDEPWWYLLLVRRVFINVYVDMARMEERIMNNQNLEWMIVRPTRLTNIFQVS